MTRVTVSWRDFKRSLNYGRISLKRSLLYLWDKDRCKCFIGKMIGGWRGIMKKEQGNNGIMPFWVVQQWNDENFREEIIKQWTTHCSSSPVKDEANHAFWLATRCHSDFPALVPQEISCLSHRIDPLPSLFGQNGWILRASFYTNYAFIGTRWLKTRKRGIQILHEA